MAATRSEPKKVYLNDVLVGEASSWAEVHKLLRVKHIAFAGTPGMAEGPTGFYINGTFATIGLTASQKADDVA